MSTSFDYFGTTPYDKKNQDIKEIKETLKYCLEFKNNQIDHIKKSTQSSIIKCKNEITSIKAFPYEFALSIIIVLVFLYIGIDCILTYDTHKDPGVSFLGIIFLLFSFAGILPISFMYKERPKETTKDVLSKIKESEEYKNQSVLSAKNVFENQEKYLTKLAHFISSYDKSKISFITSTDSFYITSSETSSRIYKYIFIAGNKFQSGKIQTYVYVNYRNLRQYCDHKNAYFIILDDKDNIIGVHYINMIKDESDYYKVL